MNYAYDNETKNHGCTSADVERAIRASASENRTVEVARSDGAETELFAECECSDDGTYWGIDCDGNEWKVRLV